MQISPRYRDAPGFVPPIVIDDVPGPIAEPLVRQRRRLGELLAELSDDQWASKTRCELWSVKDVVAHLSDTDAFWSYSIYQGLKGTPSTTLAAFDPRATPEMLVDATRSMAPSEMLAKYQETAEQLISKIESLEGDDWGKLAEAPPGHIAMRAVASHALWDGWVHERDILLPLGLTPPEEHDEIFAGLRYGVALSPAFSLMGERPRRGEIAFEFSEPEGRLVVELRDAARVRLGGHDDAPVIRARAAELLDFVSVRGDLNPTVPESHRWLLSGLATVFES